MEINYKLPLFVAHRGAHKYSTENTLEAFRQAFTYNVDAIEGDFHLTSDKYIVCHHDPIIQHHSIKKSTLKMLRQLQPSLPTLDEILSIVPLDKKIYIEIKCGIEIFEYLAQIISDSNLKYSQIYIISFNTEVAHQAKITYPQIKVYLLYQFSEGERPSFTTLKKVLDICKVDGIGTNITAYVDKKFVQSMIDAGYSYHVWTYKTYKVDSLNKIEMMKMWGVESITLDAIDIL